MAESTSFLAAGIPSDGQAGGSASLGFDPPPRVQKLVAHLKRFMEEHVYPSEHILDAHAADPNTKWTVHPRMEELKVAQCQHTVTVVHCQKACVGGSQVLASCNSNVDSF